MRVALITGVSRRRGIGFAVAQRLLDDGYRVLTTGWSAHDADQPWGAEDVLHGLGQRAVDVEHDKVHGKRPN